MRGLTIGLGVALSAALLGLSGCGGPAHPVEEAMVANPDEWPSWGRTGHETHYSPVEEIDTGNVEDLKLAWHFDLEPGYSPTTPLMAEGKVFITTGHSLIRALDAESGKLIWEYDGGTRQRATSSLGPSRWQAQNRLSAPPRPGGRAGATRASRMTRAGSFWLPPMASSSRSTPRRAGKPGRCWMRPPMACPGNTTARRAPLAARSSLASAAAT